MTARRTGATRRPYVQRDTARWFGAPTARNDSWTERAACKGLTSTMFPGIGGHAGPALAICAGCEVREECGEYGAQEVYGVWAGTFRDEKSDRDRRYYRNKKAAGC